MSETRYQHLTFALFYSIKATVNWLT